MCNPFLLAGPARLEHWKQFRRGVADLDEAEQPAAVARYWGQAPLRSIAYDCDDPRTWPTLWEMVQAGDWCRNSVAIGMEGTLRLAGFDPGRLSLGLLWDQDASKMVLVVRVASYGAPDATAGACGRSLLLNYDWATPTSVPSGRHRWLRCFRWTQRSYQEF